MLEYLALLKEKILKKKGHDWVKIPLAISIWEQYIGLVSGVNALATLKMRDIREGDASGDSEIVK